MISVAGQDGRACIRQVARPVTSGVESEVPLSDVYVLLPSAEQAGTLTPRAARSGLIRPSELGPCELNPAGAPVPSTAPTAMRLSPFTSEGASRYCQGVPPSFPT